MGQKKKRVQWSLELLQEEALKYTSRMDFQKRSPSAYMTALKRKILNDICKHMKFQRIYWNLDSLKAESLKYKNKADFEKNSNSAYQAAHNHKVLDLICQHMEPQRISWTGEALREEALKYAYRAEFQQNSSGAYQTARNRNILDKICQHMEAKSVDWTVTKLQEEALKYAYRAEFQQNSSGAYQFAYRNNFLDQICQHMKPNPNESCDERSLIKYVQSLYPKAQKLRDRKVAIDDKPQIKGFDIDIYIPELRKGIEFDGDYWHSVSGLKRGRSNWPEEDLEKYHQIKDRHFLSKGIEILHINEKEWLEDHDKCLHKINDFLKQK
jgi:hypothetical protein